MAYTVYTVYTEAKVRAAQQSTGSSRISWAEFRVQNSVPETGAPGRAHGPPIHISILLYLGMLLSPVYPALQGSRQSWIDASLC